MDDKVQKLREYITEKSASESFVHYKWFAKWHLSIVEHIAEQLLSHYPDADPEIVRVMTWMHDYGKIVDFDNQYDHKYVEDGKNVLIGLGFDVQFAESVAENIKTLDKKENIDQANIEVQIVSSADGCSHLVGPFGSLYWWEHPDKDFEEIMQDNVHKLNTDWDKKVTLPEARAAYRAFHDMELNKAEGVIPSL
mgnify:FL=1